MKLFFKKNYKSIIIIAFDILCIPIALICKLLTNGMLKTDNPCMWTKLGGQCISCGGTHFVNDLTSFRFIDAFFDNQLLFVLTVYFFITLILFNLWWIFNLSFPKKILKLMYSIPSAVIFAYFIIGFTIWRNIPMFLNIVSVAKAITQQYL